MSRVVPVGGTLTGEDEIEDSMYRKAKARLLARELHRPAAVTEYSRLLLAPLVLLAALAATAGCKDKMGTLNPSVPRNPIVFESPQGEDAFEASLDERYDRGDADVKLLRARLSKNAFFNQQIEKADENGDGILSDTEVVSYQRRTEGEDQDEEEAEPQKNGDRTNGHRAP
jgi:hypothetical protein